jgi:D-alanyl-lipoteichoic acid acyltransferase DltB (MBOAT superfamily)
MLFNSLDFAIFLPTVFLLYWFVFQKHLRAQNALIAIASYMFYAWWDWRFLSLILFSTVVDYTVGLYLHKTDHKQRRRVLLWISIIINLGFLGFFKYFNFFIDNFVGVFSFLGYQIPSTSLNIILPVGISFYTFQTLSYTIDVYRKKLEPTKDFIAFTAFVSFFPQLVAGPIERATNLLPQFYTKRKFDYNEAVLGMRQILWGLFKKVVIADNCAQLANEIFNNSANYGGASLILGALMFTFQIYGDFSGYSDIAIGTARLFGFKLMKNFAFPYFSRDIAEFWRRWHISLSTWFRDYLYIPLGGSRGGTWMKVRNTFIIFIVSGFWHGANWTFIVWGALNAIYFLPLLLRNKNRVHTGDIAENRVLPTFKELRGMLLTFALTVLAWVFFRAEDMAHAGQFLMDLFLGLGDYMNYYKTYRLLYNFNPSLVFLIISFYLIEWFGRHNDFAIQKLLKNSPRIIRFTFYSLLLYLIFNFMVAEETPFIYFQF